MCCYDLAVFRTTGSPPSSFDELNHGFFDEGRTIGSLVSQRIQLAYALGGEADTRLDLHTTIVLLWW